MRDKINKARQKYEAMLRGGMYSNDYMKDTKKKLLEELKQDNLKRIGELRVKHNFKVNKLKAKHEIKELSSEELKNYERKLRALPLEKLKEITGEGLTKNQIYSIGAELRNRNTKSADHFMEMVEANNYFEPYKNDVEFKSLNKDGAMLTIMENNANNFYDVAEDNLQSLKEIVPLERILD